MKIRYHQHTPRAISLYMASLWHCLHPSNFSKHDPLGMTGVICHIDDILITGKTTAEHLANLEAVLEKLQEHSVRVKREKCEFIQPSVEYLGHKIDAKGLHALESKVDAITKAPIPQNLQELRSFLGLLNYYR